MPDVHPAAAHGFQNAAEAYERGRPDYPQEAIDFIATELGAGPGAKAVDLGAGTGKFTALLAAKGPTVIAVEPVAAMRERLKEKLPNVEAIDATAQSLPFESSSVDVVTAAQAFHWFGTEEVVQEIRRVLKPGGRLVLIWNVRDEETTWVAGLTALMKPYEDGAPRFKSGAWRAAVEGAPGFGPLQERQFPYRHTLPVERVVDRFASISFIGALPEDPKQQFVHSVREFLATNAETAGKETLEFPYQTKVFWLEKLS
jgi:SAM-dependent methyltransferase